MRGILMKNNNMEKLIKAEILEKLNIIEKAMTKPVKVFDSRGNFIKERSGSELFVNWAYKAGLSGNFIKEVRKKYRSYVGKKSLQDLNLDLIDELN
jgi:hypothetical protein